MRWGLGVLAVVLGLGAIGAYALTSPDPLPDDFVASMPEGDATRGERIFWTGGCTSCHAAKKAEGEDRRALGGGLVLATDFGEFVAPNISMHPEDGIGAWSEADFANALLRGVSPDRGNLYPAFPYTSYTRMTPRDIADLWAFWQTLPAVEGKSEPNRLSFPYSIRRGIGLWKRAYLSDAPAVALENASEEVARGQYLVEGPGHCGECHSPRDAAGAIKYSEWLAGAPNPDGKGRIPNITGGEGGIGSWSASDIAYYLESGFTPDYDSVGGSMVEVQENLAKLPGEDRDAIAAYLKAVPSHPTAN